MAKIQDDLGNEKVEGIAGGGAIKVVVSGHLMVQSVTVSPEVVDPEDVEMLQDLVLAAVNDGLQKAQEHSAKRMGAVTGGLKIPGLF
ncbi:MAG: YbaB/EbfC family nucleoid-associated protein [Dehalococcoidia bacterium]|nr:YbaB/EbfC family nucleoid-associated protein [Dehalococcoidia bacterium]